MLKLASVTRRRRWRGFAAAFASVLLAGILTAPPASAAPIFQMPFPCGETWYASTYDTAHGAQSNHLPDVQAVDWNLSGTEDAGEEVLAGVTGTATVSYASDYGNYVTVNMGNGWSTLYAHLASTNVSTGNTVGPLTQIGTVGNTGNSTGNHLHYEQRQDGNVKAAVFNGNAITYAYSLPGNAYTSANCAGSPVGNWEGWARVPGGIRVVGWTADPDSSSSIQAHIYIDGTGYARTADDPRSDVNAPPPTGAGIAGDHGFDDTAPTSGGTRYVCIYGINASGTQGANRAIKCDTMTLTSNPIGNFEELRRVPGGLRAIGWTFDPDSSNSIEVHGYEGYCCTSAIGAYTADESRPDLAGPHPGYGTSHGFSEFMSISSAGNHTVCMYGINESGSPGSNALVKPESGDCRTKNISHDPYGNFESLTAVSGGAQAVGWAIDPDTGSRIHLDFYEGTCCGTYRGSAWADQTRTDVGAWNPEYGDDHGFNQFFSLSPGAHTLCAYAINDGAGTSPLLSCKNVTV